MKVHFKWGLSGFTGTADDAIYYYNPRLKRCIMREYKCPNNPVNTERTISIMANLKLLQPSEGYRLNFYDYVVCYNDSKEYQHKPLYSWNNAWLRMMFALQKAMPEQVNLKTITREQIYNENLPCISLKAAIEAGLLPMLPDYQRWDKYM